MTFKFVVFAAFVAVTHAGHLGLGAISPAVAYGGHGAISTYSNIQNHAAPLVHASPVFHTAPVVHAAPVVHPETFAPAHYDFGYAVSDPHTGDNKHQQESRRGDVVHGSYSLLESDGSKRTVEYSADPHNGFNAVVHKEQGVHPAPLVASSAIAHSYAAPAIAHSYAAPVVAHAAAPVVAHAPSVATSYATSVLSHGVASTYAHRAPVLAHGW